MSPRRDYPLKVLIACERSGVMREAFRRLGHDAWSNDLVPADDGSEFHLQGDALKFIGKQHWDLLIAHPVCTYLTNSAEWAYGDGPYHMTLKPETLVGAARRAARIEAVAFVKALMAAPIEHIAVENPRGHLSSAIRRPDQTIQPHDFGDDASKATCLWLKNLPKLIGTYSIAPRMVGGKPRWANQTDRGQNRLSPSDTRSDERSKTYPGFAAAAAEQWSQYLTSLAEQW